MTTKEKYHQHFKTPEGYFESLPTKISEKIPLEAKSQPALRLFPRLAYIIAIVFLVFFGVRFFNPVTEDKSLDADSIESYLVENADMSLVVEAYIEDYELETTDEDIDYLIDNDIDVNSIILEL